VDTKFESYFFKKTIILVKAWASVESRIMGSAFGLLGTYAIEILIIYVLNCFPPEPTPLDAFRKFIEVFASFNWEENVITCCGIIPVDTFYESVKGGKRTPEQVCRGGT
jgi:poly(A) polymerase Pap1